MKYLMRLYFFLSEWTRFTFGLLKTKRKRNANWQQEKIFAEYNVSPYNRW